MPEFTYKAVRKGGEPYEGVVEAPDRFSVYTHVRSEGSTVVSVEEKRAQSLASLLERFNSIFSTVSMSDKIIFARNMGTMVEAGLPLSRALSVMERQTKNARFKKVLYGLGADISKGVSLHGAMEKVKGTFSPLFKAMVRAGEESGRLAEAFAVVAYQMERSYQLRKKVRGALIYPTIIVAAMVVIGALMLIYVVPTLTQTFEELEIELPTSTLVIVTVSKLLANHTLLILAGFIGLVALLVALFRTAQGKRLFDFLILHVPPIASIAREVNAARVTRTLASLLSAGVEMVSAIGITRDVVQNSYYKEILTAAESDVQEGKPLSDAFESDKGLFPVLVGEMVAVGEETGKLADLLEQIATFYEGEVEQKAKNLSTIIEPALMIVVGTIVGFFAYSMITPIYSISAGL